jgi:hypothetical protein
LVGIRKRNNIGENQYGADECNEGHAVTNGVYVAATNSRKIFTETPGIEFWELHLSVDHKVKFWRKPHMIEEILLPRLT